MISVQGLHQNYVPFISEINTNVLCQLRQQTHPDSLSCSIPHKIWTQFCPAILSYFGYIISSQWIHCDVFTHILQGCFTWIMDKLQWLQWDFESKHKQFLPSNHCLQNSGHFQCDPHLVQRLEYYRMTNQVNSLTPGKFEWNFRHNFQTDFRDWWLRHLLWNCPNVDVTGLQW